MDKTLIELSQKYNYAISLLTQSLRFIDFPSSKNISREDLGNTVLLNVPVQSPFIKVNNNLQLEVQWYVRRKMIAHAYEDETDY